MPRDDHQVKLITLIHNLVSVEEITVVDDQESINKSGQSFIADGTVFLCLCQLFEQMKCICEFFTSKIWWNYWFIESKIEQILLVIDNDMKTKLNAWVKGGGTFSREIGPLMKCDLTSLHSVRASFLVYLFLKTLILQQQSWWNQSLNVACTLNRTAIGNHNFYYTKR